MVFMGIGIFKSWAYVLGTSCAVSGTGFFFSRRIIEKYGGWKFFLLTEDIQFTVDNVLSEKKIGYCQGAMLYDEQPVTFQQSFRQRMRWAKGFFQVFHRYGPTCLKVPYNVVRHVMIC